MFFYRLKRFSALFSATLVAVGLFLGVRMANVDRFAALEGERTFYLDSASSQALCMQTLSVAALFRVKGESVAFVPKAGEDGEAIAKEIAARYGAEILVVERTGEVVSYYAYTPMWRECAFVAGETINLHIAIGVSTAAVGSPIIFGGF